MSIRSARRSATELGNIAQHVVAFGHLAALDPRHQVIERLFAHLARRAAMARAGDHAAQAEIVQNLGPVAAIDDGAVLGDVDRQIDLPGVEDASLQAVVFRFASIANSPPRAPPSASRASRCPRTGLSIKCISAH